MTADWRQRWDLSYLPDVFGPLVGAGSVEVAMIRTLELWLPTYIAEVNRQVGTPLLSVPKSYLYQPDERPIAAGTSQVMVIVPGTLGAPERNAGSQQAGAYRATFDARVSVFFGGVQDFNESRAIAHAYEASVRAAIVQHPSLGDFAEATKWTASHAGSEARSSTYWRMYVLVHFAVVVANAVAPFGGPPAPSVGAPAAVGEVTYTGVDIEQEETA